MYSVYSMSLLRYFSSPRCVMAAFSYKQLTINETLNPTVSLAGLGVTRLVRLARNVCVLLTIALVFVSTLSVVLALSYGPEASDSSGTVPVRNNWSKRYPNDIFSITHFCQWESVLL